MKSGRFSPVVGKDGHIPPPRFDELADIGDKSDRYRLIRERVDEMFPADTVMDRAPEFMAKYKKRNYLPIKTVEEIGYDPYNCPDDPPENYPAEWLTLDIIENWNPDDTEPRSHIYQGICVFDYDTEFDKAMRYREMEVPFVIQNDPAVLRAVERWNEPGYLEEVIGDKARHTEYSVNNHFMYWTMPRNKKGRGGKSHFPAEWSKPTEYIRMTYSEWLQKAISATETNLDKNSPHWYFRLIGNGRMKADQRDVESEWIFDELTFFQPTEDNPLYLPEPKQQRGIHCRFGMKAVIAENHFDGSRNMVALFGGERRYILSHPKECESLCLYEKGHPSARHSAVDWSEPNLQEYPKFKNAHSNEVVMQAGDVLYIPTDWFHYIVSLGVNWQCNTRSGVDKKYRNEMNACGF